jgi:hypothetical protein
MILCCRCSRLRKVTQAGKQPGRREGGIQCPYTSPGLCLSCFGLCHPPNGRIVLIELRAEAEGLKSAEIELSSHAVLEKDRLSTTMPDAGLPSNLMRGPTPPGPSVHQTRFPIAVASITPVPMQQMQRRARTTMTTPNGPATRRRGMPGLSMSLPNRSHRARST